MTFPDVDTMVLDFLEPRIDPVPVHGSIPATRPSRFVYARRNGGAALNRVLERAVVTVDAWADDSVEASRLAEACRSLFLNESRHMPLVRGVDEISGPTDTPDPESKHARYRFTVRLAVRAII